MKIALIGYGKMGKAIEEIALQRGHEITVKIDVDNQSDFDSKAFAEADVAIEFTSPSTAPVNCLKALDRGVKVVSGSTGWTDRISEIEEHCLAKPGTAFLWSSNYSLGVNIFFRLNRFLSKIMSRVDGYTPSLTEIHHIHKLDHPSGTAITLARDLIDAVPSLKEWTEAAPAATEQLLVNHRREGEVPGTHIVQWDSDIDTITIQHEAKNRRGFALGAVMAAEWIASKEGVVSMDMFMDDIIPNS